ncbi:MAG: dihydroneopterin aldolase [Syntrophomonas sp.]
MDKIMARGLKFKGCHGVLEIEQHTPQEFVIDLELDLDLAPAGLKDELELTVDYDQVFHTVRKIVENKSYKLIETLAENIARAILENFAVSAVEVTVYKPNAPVDGIFDYFAVKITRRQNVEI